MMDNFEKCSFSIVEKVGKGPSKRWGHTAVLHKQAMVVFGGKLQNKEKKSIEPLYRLPLSTNEFERISMEKGPQLRDSHSCVIVKDKLYVWGGCVDEKVRNDMYCFNDVYWRKVHQQGRIPAARESQLAVCYMDRWIFLYGGCANSIVFQDMFLFDTQNNTWTELGQFLGRLPLRTDASVCLSKGDIIIFGGRDRKKKYTNDMFRLRIEWPPESKSLQSSTVVIQQVEYSNRAPPQRSGHGALTYKGRYMVVIGGQRDSSAGTHKKSQLDLLNDVWVFDFETLLWLRVRPANEAKFCKRTNFSAVIYNHSVYIFGGIKQTQNFTSFDDVVMLSIGHSTRVVTAPSEAQKLCFTCLSFTEQINQRMVIQHVQTRHFPQIDLRSIYYLSKFIRHPFEAIGLITNHFALRQSKRIDIRSETVGDHQILKICSESSPQSWQQIRNKMYRLKQTEKLGLLQNCLEYACFRVALRFLVINKQADNIHLVLHTNTQTYACSINIKMKTVPQYQQHSFNMIRKFIINKVTFESLCQSEQQIILIDLQRNPMCQTYPQLIAQNSDIINTYSRLYPTKYHNHHLDKYLSQYMRFCWMIAPENLQISLNGKQIPVTSYKAVINSWLEQDPDKLIVEKPPNTVVLFTPEHNKSCLMYYRNNLLKGFYKGELCEKYSGIVETSYLGVKPNQIDDGVLSGIILRHYNTEGMKRGPIVTVENLQEESRQSKEMTASETVGI